MSLSYTNEFFNTKIDLKDEDISIVERQYNFIFPEEVRQHYLVFNGGEPKRNIFLDSEGYEYVVQHFIPMKWKNDMGGGNLETALNLFRVDLVLPDWLIPFADDPGGNLFCFSLKPDDSGSIYYWDHEYEYGGDPEEHISYLSGSLKEFIELMVKEQ